MPRSEHAANQKRAATGRFARSTGRRELPLKAQVATLKARVREVELSNLAELAEQQQRFDEREANIRAEAARDLADAEQEAAAALLRRIDAANEAHRRHEAHLRSELQQAQMRATESGELAASREAELAELRGEHDKVSTNAESKAKDAAVRTCQLHALKRRVKRSAQTLQLERARHLRTKQRLAASVDLVKQARDELDAAEEDAAASAAASDSPPPAPATVTGGDEADTCQRTTKRHLGNVESARNRRRWRTAARELLSSHFGEKQLAAAVEGLHHQLTSRTQQLARELGRMPLVDAKTALHPDVLRALRCEGAREFAQALEQHWSVDNCATIKYFNYLSRYKYNDVRLRLSSAWRRDEGGWVRCEGPYGVEFPRLCSRYKIDMYAGMAREEAGITKFAEGRGVLCDLRKLLEACVLQAVKDGYFRIENGKVVQADGRDPEVMFFMDAANHHRSVKVTAAAVLLPEGCENPMAPSNNHEFALVEADDGATSFASVAKPLADVTNDILDDPELDGLSFPGHEGALSCSLRPFLGGDQKFFTGAFCVSSCNGPYPCGFCECPKAELHRTDKTYPKRTRKRIDLLAHARLGKCPGCTLDIVERVTNKKTQTKLLTSTSHVPTKKVGGKSHLQAHLGICAGQQCTFNCEPADFVICMLHARLCIVGSLFTRTIVQQVGKLKEAYKQAGCGDGAEYDPADLVVKCLDKYGMAMKASKIKDQTAKKVDKMNMEYTSFSFVGRDSEILTGAHTDLLKIIYPEAMTGPWLSESVAHGDDDASIAARSRAEAKSRNEEAHRQLLRARRAWHAWIKLFKVWDSDLTAGSTWSSRADEVKRLADIFAEKHVAACGATEGLYLHLIPAHVPDQIRKWGDMRRRESQGLEHCHSIRKTIGKMCSNKKKSQRMQTILTHVTIIDSLLREESSRISSLHEKRKAAKLKRHYAKVKRLLATMPSEEVTRGMYPTAS